MKKLLTIAGSDSIGGAGIQGDIKTFSAFRCYSMSVITAVTAQNTCGVLDVQNISPTMIQKQIEAIFADVPPDGIKIGMLSIPETIHAVADGLKKYPLPPTILDPVMVSKSGFPLLQPNSIELLKKELLPLSDMLTPNIPEAEVLCDMEIHCRQDMEYAARRLYETGVKSILIKGGHLRNAADDLLYDGIKMHWFPGIRIPTKNTHGTGCTLSSAIAASLAKGLPPAEAVKTAKEYITGAIEHSLALGYGCGPTNHFYQLWNS